VSKEPSQPSSMSPLLGSQPDRQAREAYAEKCAAILISAYRKADCENPEMWLTNAVTMLGQYPGAVMAEVCNPRSGLQTRSKWLPTIAEIREACDRVLAEHQARERRTHLNEHRVLVDTPRGPMTEPDAERLRLGKPLQGITSHLRIAGPVEQKAASQEEWVDRCLRELLTRMAAHDRKANAQRPPGTARARFELECVLRWNLGLAPRTFEVVYNFLLDNPEVYHEAVEIRRKSEGTSDAAWRHIADAVNSAGLRISLPVRPERTQAHERSATPGARRRVAESWETQRRTMKRSVYAKPNEPPPGLTDADRQAWYERRLETLKGQPAAGLSAEALAIMGRPSIDRAPAATEHLEAAE
jgi:hypothetical protein